MSLIQFLLSLVLLAAIGVTWRRVRQNAIRRTEGSFWSVVWLAIGVVVWWPGITNRIANAVGVGRGADLMLYGAVIALLLLVFQLHIAHDKLERQLTDLVRRDALRDVPQNKP